MDIKDTDIQCGTALSTWLCTVRWRFDIKIKRVGERPASMRLLGLCGQSKQASHAHDILIKIKF